MRVLKIMLLSFLAYAVYAEDGPRFTVMEKDEGRSKVMQLRKGIEDQVCLAEEREKRLQAMESSLYSIALEGNAEERLRTYIALRNKVQQMQEELKHCNEKQLRLAGMLDVSAEMADNLPQVTAYLGEARNTLYSLGNSQQATKKRLERLLIGIKFGIRNVPAPDEFNTKGGLRMRLIRTGTGSFYISCQPVVAGNVTLEEAMKKLREMSRAEGALYRLPSRKECQMLSQRRLHPSCAIWLNERDKDKSLEENLARERFEVVMYQIWDYSKVLGRGEIFGELPQAKYPEVGCYAVTDIKTGWQKQWRGMLGSASAEELAP